jgi:poly-gamma-glutamate synthesis protein (capsule biosynthesis protein)
MRRSRQSVDRWLLLSLAAASTLGAAGTVALGGLPPSPLPGEERADMEPPDETAVMTLFLCGDVMTGRGIDQVLPHPSDPRLHEGYMRSARGYVDLAERANGPITRPVAFSYVWGDTLRELERADPDVRIGNLETAVTTSDDHWPRKGINYRMHPKNAPCLSAAGIDCYVLANNHVLDWGYDGLTETLATLQKADLKTAGAGSDATEAGAPAIMEIAGKGRVLVYSLGSTTSGIPASWAAGTDRPGVDLLADLSPQEVQRIARMVAIVKRPGDVVVGSIHWGSNWGYDIPREQTAFAHALIDEAGVDVIHGHSSHHPRPIEVHHGKLILYGCGDFLNDYEGIAGYEAYRDDLGLMYFATVRPSDGRLVGLRMVPTKIRHFRVNLASPRDGRWLADVLSRKGKRHGTRVEVGDDGRLTLRWDE